MNKIYKLIWSKTKNCWVVASELAKGHGKNKSRIKNSLLTVFVMSALLAGGVADVQALTQQEKEEVAKYLLDKIAHGGEIPGVDASRGSTNFPDAIAYRIQYFNEIAPAISDQMIKKGLTRQYFAVRPDYIEPGRDYLNRYADSTWTNVNNDGAFGAHSMALGYRAFSEAKDSVAIGRSALAGGSKNSDGSYGGDGGVAIGNSAWALGDKAVSVGNAARAVHKGIAIGIQAEAGLDEDDNTTDLSLNSSYTPKQGKSIQYDPKSKLPYVTSDITKKLSSIAIGTDAKAWGNGANAIGGKAKATGNYAWSIGNNSEASAMDAIAFGNETSAKGIGAIAIGSENGVKEGGAQAYSGDTIAIGRGAKAGNEDDTEIAYNTVAIGKNAKAIRVYTGKKINDAVLLGANTQVTRERGIAVGANAYVDGVSGAAFGDNASVIADEGLAIGKKAKVAYNSTKSIAIGSGAEVQSSETAVAVGTGAVVGGNSSDAIAIGTGAKTQKGAKRSIVIGKDAVVTGYDSVAIGTNASTDLYNSVAIGNGAKAILSDGIALGSGSKTTVSSGYKGYDPYKGGFNIDANPGAAWESTKAALSVGDVGNNITRQITSVAAGRNDTDAVNVAQLKKLRDYTDTKMNSWVLKATSDKGAAVEGKKVNNTDNAVTFDVEKNQGLTVKRDGATIKYGVDSRTLTNHIINSVIENINGGGIPINNISTQFSISGADAATKKNLTLSKTSTPNIQFLGTTDETTVTIDGDAINPTVTVGLDSKFTQRVTTNEGNIKKNTTAIDGLTTKVEANENNITLNKNAIAGLTPKVTTNTADIGKLKAGFTVKDGGTGKADVTLGGNDKQSVTFKAAVDKTTEATADTKSLSSSVDANRNVTYTLNMSQLKKDLGITDGPDGVMSSWKLKAAGETTPQEIKNGNEVIFEAAGDGLTVTRKDSTIKYTIDGSKINLAGNTSITNLSNEIEKSKIHYFSVKSDDSANPDGTNWKNDGATGENAIAIGQKAGATGTSDIAIGTEAKATGGWGVAIGQAAKAQASTAVAMAYGAEAKGNNSLAIGILSEARTDDSTAYGREAKALGEVALAVGMRAKAEGDHSAVFGAEATTDSTAWNGTAIGRGAYIGKQMPDGTTPNTGVSNNYYTPVDDDTVVEAGKETKNSTAVGFGAKSFGYQNTALGAGAEAFDTNTVAVGVMSKAIGHYANALGKQARAEGKDSTAIGHFARALGESSMALGDYAITSTLDGTGKVNQSVALGSHARVAADNSLALGNNSLANIADDVKTEAYLSQETFKKENGVVSVGNKAYTIGDETIAQNYRRITNVAGGADDNDAVNVLQLKALETKVTANADNINKGWVLKATSDTGEEEKGKTINNTDNEVTFDVEKDQGLTVARDGKTIKYGVNNKQLVGNINSGDTAVTNISTKFSISGEKAADKKELTLSNTSAPNIQFLGTTGETTVTVGGTDTAPTVKVGLDPEFKKQVNANSDNIAANKKAIDKNAGDIKTNTDNIAANKKAIDKNAGDIKTNTDNIAANKKAIDKNAGDIKTNTDNIAANKKAIDKNAGDIKTNTDNIAANKTAIEKNATDIAGKMTSWKLKAEGVAGEEEIKDGKGVTFGVETADKGLTVTREGSTIKYGIDGSKIDIKENETVKKLEKDIENSKTTVKAGDGEKNISVAKTDGKNEYTITLAKDLKDLNSVSAKTVNASEKITVGGDKVTINNEGLTIKDGPSVKKDGIDAGKKKITGVAAGAVSEKSTEAVNGGQLFGVEQKVNINSRNISILGGKVSELGNRVNRVGAGAAALAALHPLDFDPDDKWDFAAGYGNYKGANAAAIGAYYRPNEDTMVSVGGSFGGGENMVNAGVSVKLGQGNHVTTSRVAMAKEIKDLRAEVEVLRQAIVGVGQGQELDSMKMKLFPDIAKNHWAYEAVEELTKQGLLEGYPDGTFGGDRMMTRYEFAEIVYRAMQKGLNVNEKLIQEFEPELERFRIDVISKDKNGNPVIERVRVNEKKKAK